MSLKRSQDLQGGDERYGSQSNQQAEMADQRPTHATAAQMARRKIAQTRKPSGSARSSRAGTPTAPNPLQQQSMGSFLPQSGGAGSDGGTGFNFTAGTPSNNPFAQQNGTPPPTNPFGQQNGGISFGGNNSFGGSFGGNNNATQAPQQNGFSNSSISGMNNTSSTPTFGGFGQNTQTTQPQQNGITPTTATTSSFPSFGKQNNENPFKGFQFSQTPQQTQSTPGTSFGGFNSQQQNGEKTPRTPSFGGFGSQKPAEKSSLFPSTSETPKPSSSLFSTDTPKPSTGLFSGGSLGQPNGASKPEETPKTNSTSLFSNLQQNSSTKGLFGASTSLPEQRPTSPGGSVLTGLDSARASTITQGMFTQNKTSETPKTSLFQFGQPAGDSASEETPKASSNLFSAAKTNGATSNLFSGASNTEQQTPAKPTGGLFSGSFGQQPQQSNSTPGFTFGQSAQSQQDTSMTTPGNTPQKPSTSIFQQSLSKPAAKETTAESASPSETPTGQGKSLFDRISSRDEAPATAQKPSFTPSTSMFSAANNKENETPSSRSLFQQPSRDEQPSDSQQQQTSFTPSTSLFSKPASQASQTPSAAPWLSHAAAAPTPPTTKVTPATPQPPATVTRAATSTVSMSELISGSEKGTFKLLNEGLMKHLTTQDANADWTTIMQYYLQQAAKIRSKPEPTFDAPVAAQTTARPPSSGGLLGGKSLFSPQSTSLPQAPKPSTPSSNSNMFNSSSTSKPATSIASDLFTGAQTPKQSTFNSQPSKPPATAPVNRKRPGPFTEDDDDEEAERGPATEKRARHDEPINYPKLPAGASETSKLFQAALDKPADKATNGSEHQSTSNSSIGGFKPSTSSSNGGFKPSESSSGGGSKSATSTSMSAAAGFTPLNSGPPTVSPTTLKSGGFLASFGKQASEVEKKEKEKRKLDDYDSEEETQDEWDKRYEEQQAAKRQKLKDDSQKVSGFVFNAAAAKKSSDAVSVFSHLSQSASEASDNETEDDKADGEKAQGYGDNTWNMKTPIKFGNSTIGKESTTPAAPPPTFGNLFGSTPATGSSSFLSVPSAKKPSIGFNFTPNTGSSAGTSRASTPGVTTDGEASTAGDGDDEEAQSNEPQVEDQTALKPEEMVDEELVYSLPTVTAKKIKIIKDPEAPGGEKKAWDTIANGPLYVLRNKDTGKTRVLLKVPPFGKPKMNFPPVAKMNYEIKGKNKGMVQGAFVDHINESTPKLVPFLIEAGKGNGEELAKVLNENRPTPEPPKAAE